MRAAILILAAAIVAAPLIWRLTAPEGGSGADAEAQATLRARVAFLEDEARALLERLDALETRMTAWQGELDPDVTLPDTPVTDFGGFDELMLLGSRGQINAGLSPIGVYELVDTFGVPAPDLHDQCVEPTSQRLLETLEIRDVGPFRARMIRPALDSLERIFDRLETNYPALYAMVRTYGGFCVRLVRGSTESISRHAFGVALDVSIGGTLDEMGDGYTQFGLIVLNDLFAEEGWYWGAAFEREDSMHFEVSAELFRRWRDEGLL